MQNPIFLLCLLASMPLFGQQQILFSEDFEVDPSASWLAVPTGNDQNWVNFDEDGQAMALPNIPSNWFWEEFTYPQSAGPDIVERVMASCSYLINSAKTTRNWLMLPPIFIPDSAISLCWKSAPFQGPNYHDGYKVLVSDVGNYETEFVDTLFVQAEMLMAIDPKSSDPSDYVFSAGYVHANNFTDSTFFMPQFGGPQFGWSNTCFLEPHEVSLKKYGGQTIYIAFLHESQDDDILKIDDIQIVQNKLVGTENLAEISNFELFPNPTADFLNLRFELKNTRFCQISIKNTDGRLLFFEKSEDRPSGKNDWKIDARSLSSGSYFLEMQTEQGVFQKPFLRF